MREMHRPEQFDPLSPPHADCRRFPFPHAVDCKDSRLFKRRRKKCRCRMRLMMPCERDALPELAPQRLSDLPGQVKLLLQPERDGLQERAQSRRGLRHMRLEQSIELQQGL